MKLKKYYALKYLPKKLSRRDTTYEKKQLDKSRKLYTQKKYYTRKRVALYMPLKIYLLPKNWQKKQDVVLPP